MGIGTRDGDECIILLGSPVAVVIIIRSLLYRTVLGESI